MAETSKCESKGPATSACVCEKATLVDRKIISGKTDVGECATAIDGDMDKSEALKNASNKEAFDKLMTLSGGGKPPSDDPTKSTVGGTDAAPEATTGDAVVRKLMGNKKLTDVEFGLITPEYIKTLMKSRSPIQKALLAAIEENAGQYPVLAKALAEAKEPVEPRTPRESQNFTHPLHNSNLSFGSHSGFFGELDVGLSFKAATYSDSVTRSDSLATDNSIKTGAYGVSKSLAGIYPGHRFGASLGYAFPINKDVYVRAGVHVRKSSIQQAYENPQFGRIVPDLSQWSWMAFMGVEKYITPDFSVFADAMLGITSNSFSEDITKNLQTSAQSNQYAPLDKMEDIYLSFKVRGGAAYRIRGCLSVYAALDVYGDRTNASAKTDGGGLIEYGTSGVEVTATGGLKCGR